MLASGTAAADPLLVYVRELVEANQAKREEIAALESQVKSAIAAAVDFAVNSPYPKPEEAGERLFRQESDYERTCLLRS